MHWVLLDIGIAALAVLCFALAAYLGYRAVRRFLRTAGSASSRIGELTAGLSVTPPQPRTRD